ncbi:MAG: hypothetical protein ACQESG_06865 [Nanobdellota archaeon]
MVFILSLVNIAYAGTVESGKGHFEVIYPDEIAVSDAFKVQLKIDSEVQNKANIINTKGCYLMHSNFEDEDLKAKLPPIGQRAYTQYFGDELLTLEMVTYPFSSSANEKYSNYCKIQFKECRDDCDSLGFRFAHDSATFTIKRDEALTTNLVTPTSYDQRFSNLNEAKIDTAGIVSGSDTYDYTMYPKPYPYKYEAYGEKFYFADEEQLNKYIDLQMESDSRWEAVEYDAGTGFRAFYVFEGYHTTAGEPDEVDTVYSKLKATIFYRHFMIHLGVIKSTEGVKGPDKPAVRAANDAELVEILKTFTLTDGTTEYSGEFTDDVEKIDYEEEDNEPKYPLYDPYFDYDGDGMLDDEEYADYYEVEQEKLKYFNQHYNDSEKIEYKEPEPTEGEPKITSFDLPDLLANVNTYEGAILQKSDVVVGEVKNAKEDIDKLSKRINALKSSFKVLAKNADDNKEALDDLLERIKVSQEELEEKTKQQTDMIKSIDKEYAILLKKLDKDISIANDDDVKGLLEDKRKAILDNARYAKVNAYFHSGNDAEFQKIAQKMRLGTGSETVSKISLLTGLKKLERGMPQSALHDFKSAMVEDPDNPVARDLTNKIETAYLDSIETKLMAEMHSDAKAYDKSNQVGKDGTFNYAGDLLTTGIGSSTGALFGYEEAKALESDVLQTEVSKQIAGIQITKALMGSGMTLKEVKALESPEEFQVLAEKFGKSITQDQAKKYREMVYQAHNNPDVEKISDNSLMPLQVDSRRSYYKNNYDKGLVTNVLDAVNVKNVLVTLGPSAVFTHGGKLTTTKDFIRETAKIDKFQRWLMTRKVGDATTKFGKLLRMTSTRLGKDFKTISQYGDARKFLVGQGLGMAESTALGKGSEWVLGKEKGKVFADFYDGISAFTGIIDLGDLTEVAGKIDDSEFEDLTEGIRQGLMKKEDLVEGQNLMKQDLDEALEVSNIENAADAREKILKSLSSKDKIDDDVLDEMQKKITKAKASIGKSKSKIAEVKRTQLESAENAITSYKNKDFAQAKKMAQKARHMDDMITETVGDMKIRHRMSEKAAELADSVEVPEKVELSEMIKEKPLKVADTSLPKIDIDANTGKVTVNPEGTLDLSISINDNAPNKGWAKVIENADDMAKAVGYTGIQDEADRFSMKLLDLVVKKTVPDMVKTGVDKTTKEYVFVLDLPNANNILVKVKPQEEQNSHEKIMAEVTNALVMTDTNLERNIRKGRYEIIE